MSFIVLFAQPIPGANNLDAYFNLIKGKRVGLVVNQTSNINQTHLVDTLKKSGINIVRIFGPEHGFRGNADAGEHINNDTDAKTGIPVVSLYGKNKKPTSEQVSDLDIILFDIQDVGVRFYTYISTLHHVMEACAENNKLLIVLDRPNPNGMYIDGPVLDTTYKSFVGMHPVPIVYGMTIGEYAQMIKGEKWIKSASGLNLKVINCNNYTHNSKYNLPIKPSPNLPNALSIALYPSLCLFEGTNVSVARGTQFPFQAIGYPDSTFGSFYFIPESIEGMSKDPMHKGKKCYGMDLRNSKIKYEFTLKYVIDFYSKSSKKELFFNNFCIKLIGDKVTLDAIINAIPESEIKKMWQPGIINFKSYRQKYLLYPE
ncbi:MAG: DUF1343 domain-containing protein [Bacteroidota bacterium]|nr:DUF1343 domain-containing protein [Bacteroidota bacterium]